MAPFTSFPSEIISLIVETFNYHDLYQCTLTNKQLYRATNCLLWRFPALTNKNSIQKFLNGLTASIVGPTSVGQWITRLSLQNNYWTDHHLWMLMAHDLTQLEDLRLVATQQLTESSLSFLPQQCPKLKSLFLWHVPHLHSDFIQAVGMHCLYLTKFVCYGCPQLMLVDTISHLKQCSIKVIHFELPPSPPTELMIWDLVIHYPFLTNLSIVDNDMVSRRFNDPNGVSCILSAGMSAWPYLETLTIYGYDDPLRLRRDEEMNTLVEFLQYHPGMMNLTLKECRHIQTSTFEAMSLLDLPCLIELTITHTDKLSPKAVRQFIHSCPELDSILLIDCQKITALMFPEVGIQCGNENHKHFYVNHLDQEHIEKIRHSN